LLLAGSHSVSARVSSRSSTSVPVSCQTWVPRSRRKIRHVPLVGWNITDHQTPSANQSLLSGLEAVALSVSGV
jgi:hypothetical protein